MIRQPKADMNHEFYLFALKELQEKIVGCRLQKIFSPAPHLWTLDFGQIGYLIIHLSQASFFFYLSYAKPLNPPVPQTQVIWLRKRICNYKIKSLYSAWPSRQLIFSFIGRDDFFVLDCKKGLSLQTTLPPNISAEPDLKSLLQNDLHRQIQTKTDLKFLYSPPNPSPLLQTSKNPENGEQIFSSALQAAENCYAAKVNELVGGIQETTKEQHRRFKRLQRNLEKLDEDEKRLQKMIEQEKNGELLKSVLYTYSPQEKYSELKIDFENEQIILPLEPHLTLQENMEKFFHKSKKGKRGFEFIATRRKELQKELAEEKKHTVVVPKIGFVSLKNKKKKYPSLAIYKLPAGWTILRGKDSKANHLLLSEFSSPFDYWLHAANCPGAHIILKRDFPTQEVDANSLTLAAGLAGLYSWQKQAQKAEVLCALVKNVRKNKGAKLGQVVVDAVLTNLRVPIEAEKLEQFRID